MRKMRKWTTNLSDDELAFLNYIKKNPSTILELENKLPLNYAEIRRIFYAMRRKNLLAYAL